MTEEERDNFWEDAYQAYILEGYTVYVAMDYADQDTQDMLDTLL